MTHKQRLCAHEEIFQKGYIGIGMADEKLIDRINILEATFYAMTEAVNDLLKKIPKEAMGSENFMSQTCLLVDGNLFRTSLPFAYQTIIRGDSLSLSIACASIVAKVTRDCMMEDYDKIYPQYGFAQHKGYPTLKHKNRIKEFGLSAIHRKTFKYWT
ncbi:MAG: ribonuclease HII, partial [Candidatus Omnitrophica bacterium]|nr:ribonuclease HII [Candidatus Omnitrophota bacterium]